MKKYMIIISRVMAFLMVFLLCSCRGSPIDLLGPVGVTVKADGDRIIVSWAASSTGTHNIYVSENSAMNSQNYAKHASPISSPVSPALVPSLEDFTTYYVVVTRKMLGVEVASQRYVVETGGHKWPVAVSDSFVIDYDTLNAEGGIALAFSSATDIKTNDYHPNPARSIQQVDLNPNTTTVETTFAFPGEGTWQYTGGVLTFTSSGTLFNQPTPINYTVIDNAGLVSAPATITLRYNLIPKVTVTSMTTMPLCEPTTLLVTASSINGDIESYVWSQVSGPAVTLLGSDTATPSFLPPLAGDYRFEVVVADVTNKTASKQTNLINAKPNLSVWPPVASSGERVRVGGCPTLNTSANFTVDTATVTPASLLDSDLDFADFLLPHISSANDSGIKTIAFTGQADSSIQVDDVRDVTGVSVNGLSVTGDFGCLSSNKLIRCWGDSAGYNGLMMGVPTNMSLKRARPESTAVTFMNSLKTSLFSSMAIGKKHGCQAATFQDAPQSVILYCWGDNTFGQAGNGTAIDIVAPTLRFISALNSSPSLPGYFGRLLAAGDKHTCSSVSSNAAGFSVAQAIKCWGTNDRGQLGIGSNVNQTVNSSTLPIAGSAVAVGYAAGVTPPATIESLKASGSTNCMKGDDRILYCWGANDFGQIGNGTTTDQLLATPVDFNSDGLINANDRIFDFSIGGSTVCAIQNVPEKRLRCWGDNRYGQVNPQSAQAMYTQPLHVRDGVQNVWAAANNAVCFTLLTTSQAWCMGDNSEYQFGMGSSDHAIPVNGEMAADASNRKRGLVAVPRLNGMTAYAGAPRNDGPSWFNTSGSPGMTTCAVLGGQAFCWGTDESAADGSRYNHPILGNPLPRYADGVIANPVAIEFTKTLGNFSMGPFHACGINENEGVSCWGDAHRGGLGDGTQAGSIDRPVVMQDVADVLKVSVGAESTCALLVGGDVKCAGRGKEGQLMNQDIVDHAIPQLAVNELVPHSTPVDIDAGADTACVILADTTVACAGNGVDFGLGNNLSGNVPVLSDRVLLEDVPLASVVDIDNGMGACAMQANGNVYCWGDNSKGQGGTGVSGNLSTAQLVKTSMSGLADSYASTRCAYKNSVTPEVWCWGDSSHNQAGIAGGQADTPVKVGGTDFSFPAAIVQVVVGGGHIEGEGAHNSCALLNNGDVYCWGNGVVNDSVPQRVYGFGQATELVASEYQVCAYSGSTLKCKGLISSTSGDIQAYDHRVPRVLRPLL